jgi:hypothetical protein
MAGGSLAADAQVVRRTAPAEEAGLRKRRQKQGLTQKQPTNEQTESGSLGAHARDLSVERWKIEVNDRYQRIIDLLIGLATGSLVLPPLFLKDFLGVKDEPIAMFLDDWAYGTFGAFAGTVLLGILFHYVSAKWVKEASGQRVRFFGGHLEAMLDWLFWLTVLAFGAGIACFAGFVTHS